MTKLLASTVALLFIAQADCLAQEQQQSFRSLMGRGYDIKSVTFVKGESTENREVFVVTLQRERSVAVCFFSAANWINLSGTTLDDAKRCDVR